MNKAEAVEVAHAVRELLATRKALKQLRRIDRAFIDGALVVRIATDRGTVETLELPVHVVRFLVETGPARRACEVLEREHEEVLSSLAGMTVEEDEE